MKWLSRIIAIVFFIFFFGLALKNTQETALYFFWGYELRSSGTGRTVFFHCRLHTRTVGDDTDDIQTAPGTRPVQKKQSGIRATGT